MAKKKEYNFWKTLKKTLRELLIWGVPQVAALLISVLGSTAEMSIGAVISVGAKILVDYFKHK